MTRAGGSAHGRGDDLDGSRGQGPLRERVRAAVVGRGDGGVTTAARVRPPSLNRDRRLIAGTLSPAAGRLAQPGRAPALHAGGRGGRSRHRPTHRRCRRDQWRKCPVRALHACRHDRLPLRFDASELESVGFGTCREWTPGSRRGRRRSDESAVTVMAQKTKESYEERSSSRSPLRRSQLWQSSRPPRLAWSATRRSP